MGPFQDAAKRLVNPISPRLGGSTGRGSGAPNFSGFPGRCPESIEVRPCRVAIRSAQRACSLPPCLPQCSRRPPRKMRPLCAAASVCKTPRRHRPPRSNPCNGAASPAGLGPRRKAARAGAPTIPFRTTLRGTPLCCRPRRNRRRRSAASGTSRPRPSLGPLAPASRTRSASLWRRRRAWTTTIWKMCRWRRRGMSSILTCRSARGSAASFCSPRRRSAPF